MTRRKGERTVRANEREFPHIVEMSLPEGGLGRTLDLIYDFHQERRIEVRRGGFRRRNDRDFVRWCFVSHADATAFESRFGGQVLAPIKPSHKPL